MVNELEPNRKIFPNHLQCILHGALMGVSSLWLVHTNDSKTSLPFVTKDNVFFEFKSFLKLDHFAYKLTQTKSLIIKQKFAITKFKMVEEKTRKLDCNNLHFTLF
jgi:hypothetical protein